jgi:hypothetical protein
VAPVVRTLSYRASITFNVEWYGPALFFDVAGIALIVTR